MAIAIRICVLLMLFGIADTQEWKPDTFIKGENVTIRMDELQVNGKQILEIYFSGFTSKQHVSNVMLFDPIKKQSDHISVNKNYTRRIDRFKMNNGNLSFLLLNVNFMDSGMYTVSTLDGSVLKGKTSILVARQTILGQDGGLMNLTFMCNKTNISWIKIEMMIPKINFPVVVYNVSQEKCTEFGDLFKNQIESCLFSGITFSLAIRRVTWLERGQYVAWNDMKFLLDSVFLDIQDTQTSRLETTKEYVTLPSTVNGSTDSTKFAKENGSSLETRNEYQTASTAAMSGHESPNSNDKPALLVVSAVLVVVVAGCLAMIAFRKIRHIIVPSTEAVDITYRNISKPTPNSSRNLYKNVKAAVPTEEARIVLVKNNIALNLTDNTNNKGQVKVRLQEENICYRQFDYADSSTRTPRSFQIDSLAHLYDYILENHDQCWSHESNLCSSPNSTQSMAEPSFEYDYVVQHSFMTLRPPAPDPAVTRKTKDQGTRASSVLWYQRLNRKSTFSVDPLTLHAEISKERSRESNRTVSSSEPGSRDFINQLAPSRYFELEGIRATGTMNSPYWLTYGFGPNWRKVENLNCSNFVSSPEFSELRDKSESRRLAQLLNYDYPRSYFDHHSALDRRHRRSQSLSDMMTITSVRYSRRRSAMYFMKKDCYGSI